MYLLGIFEDLRVFALFISRLCILSSRLFYRINGVLPSDTVFILDFERGSDFWDSRWECKVAR